MANRPPSTLPSRRTFFPFSAHRSVTQVSPDLLFCDVAQMVRPYGCMSVLRITALPEHKLSRYFPCLPAHLSCLPCHCLQGVLGARRIPILHGPRCSTVSVLWPVLVICARTCLLSTRLYLSVVAFTNCINVYFRGKRYRHE